MNGPVAVVGDHTFTNLTAGNTHTCGLDAGGQAWCWGWNEDGQVGNGSGGQQAYVVSPVAVIGGRSFAALTAGATHTCGLDDEGTAWCWGMDEFGQLGDGDDDQADEFAPVAVSGARTFKSLDAGGHNTCGLDATGTAWCWGYNYDFGSSGEVGAAQGDYAPIEVAGGHTFVAVTAGPTSCGLDGVGRAWCWGFDMHGQVGDGSDPQWDMVLTPMAVAGGHTFSTVTNAGEHTCGIDTMGSAWCWGWDRDGQVGDGDDGQSDEFAPVAVAAPQAP